MITINRKAVSKLKSVKHQSMTWCTAHMSKNTTERSWQVWMWLDMPHDPKLKVVCASSRYMIQQFVILRHMIHA